MDRHFLLFVNLTWEKIEHNPVEIILRRKMIVGEIHPFRIGFLAFFVDLWAEFEGSRNEISMFNNSLLFR